jgi:hypothetical protein
VSLRHRWWILAVMTLAAQAAIEVVDMIRLYAHRTQDPAAGIIYGMILAVRLDLIYFLYRRRLMAAQINLIVAVGGTGYVAFWVPATIQDWAISVGWMLAVTWIAWRTVVDLRNPGPARATH